LPPVVRIVKIARKNPDMPFQEIAKMSKEIKLNHGKVAIVDDLDYALLSQYKWKANGGYNTWYAYRCEGNKTIAMHREILCASKGVQVDHANGNGLDNRRINIRLCTQSQNNANIGKTSRNQSGFKGVTKSHRKWVASLSKDGHKILIGSFNTKQEAAQAYDEAARKYHGEFAKTNF
jgi:hypothetical protein